MQPNNRPAEFLTLIDTLGQLCNIFVLFRLCFFLLKLKQFMHAIKLKAEAAATSWICGMQVNLFSSASWAA